MRESVRASCLSEITIKGTFNRLTSVAALRHLLTLHFRCIVNKRGNLIESIRTRRENIEIGLAAHTKISYDHNLSLCMFCGGEINNHLIIKVRRYFEFLACDVSKGSAKSVKILTDRK
jgi:hypothetical protein